MRLFLGLSLAPDTVSALSAAQEKLMSFSELPSEMKRIPAANMHLTVKFLGSVAPEKSAEIEATAAALARSHAPLLIDLDRLGAFPEQGQLSIIWAGSQSVSEPFRRLALDAERRFHRLGFQTEAREPVPHVTLFRVKADRSRGALRETIAQFRLPPLQEAIAELTLFQSLTHAEGVEYQPRAVYRLVG